MLMAVMVKMEADTDTPETRHANSSSLQSWSRTDAEARRGRRIKGKQRWTSISCRDVDNSGATPHGQPTAGEATQFAPLHAALSGLDSLPPCPAYIFLLVQKLWRAAAERVFAHPPPQCPVLCSPTLAPPLLPVILVTPLALRASRLTGRGEPTRNARVLHRRQARGAGTLCLRQPQHRAAPGAPPGSDSRRRSLAPPCSEPERADNPNSASSRHGDLSSLVPSAVP